MRLIKDREALVAALRERGVDYLAPSDARLDELIDDETLIANLAAHPDARLRQALIALFLLQPQLAQIALRLETTLPFSARQELLAYYAAAGYFQRMWRTRLSRYLGSVTELPDFFSAELALPSAHAGYGKAGLRALAKWHADHSPQRFNYLSAYEGVIELLFQSLKLRRNKDEFTRQR